MGIKEITTAKFSLEKRRAWGDLCGLPGPEGSPKERWEEILLDFIRLYWIFIGFYKDMQCQDEGKGFRLTEIRLGWDLGMNLPCEGGGAVAQRVWG